jgi:hypothetical protein
MKGGRKAYGKSGVEIWIKIGCPAERNAAGNEVKLTLSVYTNHQSLQDKDEEDT